MTQTTGQDLNKGCSAAALTAPARRLHRAVLAAFTDTGRSPTRGDLVRIASADGADAAAVLAELAERDVIVFDARGEIRAAYPFSPVPTPIQVRWAGGPLTYAMCAVDALGVSAMLGRPVTITAAEPGTGHIITVEVDGDRARWNPRRAVVFSGATGDTSCPSADRTCGYINFFTSARAARAWAGHNPAITGRVLRRAWALGLGVAEFGAFLRSQPR
jgi:Alkylmercury lyase